jgi:hypothetical protein
MERMADLRGRALPALMRGANPNKKKRCDRRDPEDDGEQESSYEELCGALLFWPGARNAEGRYKGFREPGEKLHAAVSIARSGSTYCRLLAIASRTPLRKSMDSGAE